MSSLSSGTTDVEYKGDPKAVAIDDKEINYLLNVYNAHFKKTLSRDDIVWTYSRRPSAVRRRVGFAAGHYPRTIP
ncbi:Aerobic glycerol-3-phosphate dehydrogenase [Klebsiella pneumoniae]|uniref:Aerobic glycerol-3-phosphate dehydrogenase n=1 Tax=Klebsiella pneumoniae TaxID=573 RepID=A0A377XJW6_KLEPN|nr:Aerobic glycerol-3-phosphate dehydrogenase [Klebsiella pneumoniae]